MSPYDVGILVITVALLVGLLVGAYRLLSGPTAADRVVALDLCTLLGIGLMAIMAIRSDNPFLLDAAMILALVAFLITVALASLIRSERPPLEPSEESSANTTPTEPTGTEPKTEEPR